MCRLILFLFSFVLSTLAMNDVVIDIDSLPLINKIPKKSKMYLLSPEEIDHIAHFINRYDAQKLCKEIKETDPLYVQQLACWTYFHSYGHDFAQKYLNGDVQLLRSAFKEKGCEVLERINELHDYHKFDLDCLYMIGFDADSATGWAMMLRELVGLPKTVKNYVSRIMKLKTYNSDCEEFPAQKKVFSIIQHHENIHYEQYRYHVRGAYCCSGCMLFLGCAFLSIFIWTIVRSMQVNRVL